MSCPLVSFSSPTPTAAARGSRRTFCGRDEGSWGETELVVWCALELVACPALPFEGSTVAVSNGGTYPSTAVYACEGGGPLSDGDAERWSAPARSTAPGTAPPRPPAGSSPVLNGTILYSVRSFPARSSRILQFSLVMCCRVLSLYCITLSGPVQSRTLLYSIRSLFSCPLVKPLYIVLFGPVRFAPVRSGPVRSGPVLSHPTSCYSVVGAHPGG
jgi:hypothetical protein